MTRNLTLAATIVVLLCAAALPAAAQSGSGPRPTTAIQLRFGQYAPQGGGAFWDESEQTFYARADDFADFAFGTTVVLSRSNRFEVGFNMDFHGSTVRTSYRDYRDEDGYAIFHDAQLDVTPLTVDVRWLPAGRYRVTQQGRLVPRTAFYVGAGAGLNFWEYEEVGDFIDFTDPLDLTLFYGWFRDDGTAFEAHVLAGVEVVVTREFNVLFEGRYSWSSDTMSGDFAGFGELGLDAASICFGMSWRF